jgi:hypothetical protein
LLLDENVERSVGARLDALGHDIERVDSVSALGPGSSDDEIAAFLDDANRVLLTYDDDFRAVRPEPSTPYVADETLPSDTVVDIVDAIATHYPQTAIDGLTYANTDWL